MNGSKTGKKAPHQMSRREKIVKGSIFIVFLIFIGISNWVGYEPGIGISKGFGSFLMEMVKILPAIFLLIGLFDVWVDRKTIQKHLGKDGGAKSYFWVFLLAAPMAGGLLPALPIGYALHQKGARLSVVLAFLGAVSVGRVPMILFESTFLGWKFSAIRLAVSIPLVIISSIILGRILESKGYELPKHE
jgi:uncharacterized membrane protein YraQ (UPF0718 family)